MRQYIYDNWYILHNPMYLHMYIRIRTYTYMYIICKPHISYVYHTYTCTHPYHIGHRKMYGISIEAWNFLPMKNQSLLFGVIVLLWCRKWCRNQRFNLRGFLVGPLLQIAGIAYKHNHICIVIASECATRNWWREQMIKIDMDFLSLITPFFNVCDVKNRFHDGYRYQIWIH